MAYEMSGQGAIRILDGLAAHGVEASVGGGWGIDALLGEQTRKHADLDLWIPADEFGHAIRALVSVDIERILPWGEDRPWNFVVHDGGNRRVDLHMYETDPDGGLRYGGLSTWTAFPTEALAGHGVIVDRPVRCEAPEWSLRWHTGFEPRPEHKADIRRLCARYDLPLPDGYR